MTAQNKNIPTLRFKQFEDKWSTSKLGNLGSFKNGLNKESKDFGFGSPFVNLMDVFGKTILEETDFGLVNATEKDIEVYSLKKGDVLFIRSSVKRSGVGETILVAKDLANTVYSGFLIRFRDNNKELDLNFKSYCFSNTPFRNELLSYATSSANTNINQESLSQIRLHFPTLPEQQKIASFLSAIDEKIQRLTRKKELLEQYKKGVMQQLFSGKLRFKDEYGKAYPKWEEKRLGDVGDIVSGLTYSPVDIHEDGVLVLRSSNVKDRRLTFDDNVYVKVDAGDFNPVRENDILICVRNGSKNLIGKNALVNKENAGLAFGAFMTVYRSDFNSYLFHYFDTDSYKDEVHKNLGATINSINGSDLKRFKIPFPSKAEQQKIASYLSSLDTKIESVATQITQSQTFKKGLLQQMFV